MRIDLMLKRGFNLRAVFERCFQLPVNIPYVDSSVAGTSRYAIGVSTEWNARPITTDLEIITAAVFVNERKMVKMLFEIQNCVLMIVQLESADFWLT